MRFGKPNPWLKALTALVAAILAVAIVAVAIECKHLSSTLDTSEDEKVPLKERAKALPR